MKQKFLATLTLTTTLAVTLSTAHSAIVNTFDSGAEGWTGASIGSLPGDAYNIVATYPVTYSATGGNPGGFISLPDLDTATFVFVAPAAFRAAMATAFGQQISYDLINSGPYNVSTTDVVIEGGGLRLLWQSNPPTNPTGGWTPETLTLAPSAQWRLSTTTGSTPSTTDFQTALANVTALYIRGEYNTGNDTGGLDNVRIVPEPSSLILLLGGFGLLSTRRRGR